VKYLRIVTGFITDFITDFVERPNAQKTRARDPATKRAQKPIRRITKRGKDRITSMMSDQIPGA
jgi:hypothetical protein